MLYSTILIIFFSALSYTQRGIVLLRCLIPTPACFISSIYTNISTNLLFQFSKKVHETHFLKVLENFIGHAIKMFSYNVNSFTNYSDSDVTFA